MDDTSVTAESYYKSADREGNPYPLLGSCHACRHLRSFKLFGLSSGKGGTVQLQTFRQSLLVKAQGMYIEFDLPEISISLPADHTFGNGRGVENVVCIAGRPPQDILTYAEAFRPSYLWGACYQQGKPENMKPLCGGHIDGKPCRSKVEKTGSIYTVESCQPRRRGKMRLVGGQLEAVGQAGPLVTPPATSGYKHIYTSFCIKCGAVVGTQENLVIDGVEEAEESIPNLSFIGHRK